MFKKILIANRGEIARRIILACHELGARAVAVYAEPDAGMPWVRLADEAYPLKGSAAGETYLNQEAIFRAARLAGAEAVHPGYGFLSENAVFAAACAAHKLTFIGPEPGVIQRMGSKAAARELAQQAHVPVVPGLDSAGLSLDELMVAIETIGYPLLIKASAGGGGKGMRIVREAADFAGALQMARSEALSSFGSDHMLVERFLEEIHHVEIQVLGDGRGKMLHLYERECSIQRRHQKIIEESPSPILTADLRARMAEAAVRLARAAGYTNAGTVEFIVDGEGNFYFLEMNTRLQVEHPVTEQLTGIDLATWQIRIAAGEAFPFGQEAVSGRGHALECRVYAEDPAADFMPSTGTLAAYRAPSGPGLRVDDGVESGAAISPYYDPMLAKVITWGQDRTEAVRKMQRALAEMIVLGVTTNIPYLQAILAHPQYIAGNTTTRFLEDYMAGWTGEITLSDDILLAAAVFEVLQRAERTTGDPSAEGNALQETAGPWTMLDSWRNVSGS
ncbi:MAG: acetyl/propionyl/methylcrotonyl-CoA carboxylase subunit alpha [Candidatus Promineifilaceae bacterium]